MSHDWWVVLAKYTSYIYIYIYGRSRESRPGVFGTFLKARDLPSHVHTPRAVVAFCGIGVFL